MLSIPGKRHRQSRVPVNGGLKPGRRGRPMKHKSDLKQPRKLMNTIVQQQHQRAQHLHLDLNTEGAAESLTPLELLPAELIQDIFFCCFETNLPRASPYIAASLSSESTYQALILFAYFNDNATHPVDEKLFLPAKYRLVNRQEKIRLQHGISRCRWFNTSRVESSLAKLAALRARQEWHVERQMEISCIKNITTSQEVELMPYRNLDISLCKLPDLRREEDLETHFLVGRRLGTLWHLSAASHQTAGGENLLQCYLPRIVTWSCQQVNADLGSGYCKIPSGIASTMDVCVIPDWVVGGETWDETRLELLKLLRYALLCGTSADTCLISKAAVLRGVASAIRSSHQRALVTLLELYDSCLRRGAAQSNPPIESPSTATFDALPLELFHLATSQGDQAASLLWLLIRASSVSVPHNDVTLTRWAVNVSSDLSPDNDGRVVAEWLLRHMDGTNGYAIDNSIPKFHAGVIDLRVCAEDMAQHWPPCSTTFRDEAGYLDEKPFLVSPR